MAFQVTNLTKNKKCYEKEFIDFEFDGKHISEFQLVAVSDGDRYSFNHSPEFEDETSSVTGAEGQYYWGTQIKTQTRTFKLETDGMTEQDLNAFKNHFRPGKYGKFIEDHLAHRYGYCRVSAVTNFQLLPFRVSRPLLGRTVEVNLYKGSADITFQFDDPYLYSDVNYVNLNNCLIDSDVQQYHPVTSANMVKAFSDDTEMLKTIYNNGIPTNNSWIVEDENNKCYIGGGYAIYQYAVRPFTASLKFIKQENLGTTLTITGTLQASWNFAKNIITNAIFTGDTVTTYTSPVGETITVNGKFDGLFSGKFLTANEIYKIQGTLKGVVTEVQAGVPYSREVVIANFTSKEITKINFGELYNTCGIVNGDAAHFIRHAGDTEDNVLIYYNPSNTSSSAKITMQIPHIFSNFVWNYNENSKKNILTSNPWKGEKPLYYASILDDINGSAIYESRINAAKAAGKTFVPPTTSVIQMSKSFPRNWLPYLPQYLPFILGGRMSEIEDDLSRLFEFTTPHFFYSINLAIKLAWDLYNKHEGAAKANATEEEIRRTTLIELEEEMLNNIKNKAVLAWIVNVLAWFKNSTSNNMKLYNATTGVLDGKAKITQLPWILCGGTELDGNINPSDEEKCQVQLNLHWAAAFNLFMLYIIASHAEVDKVTSRIDNLDEYCNKAPVRFLDLTLHIDGIKNEAYADYDYQSINPTTNNNQLIYNLQPRANKEREEKCGDCVQSHYLKLGGNNTFNQETGAIETVYCFQFYRGKDLEADYFDGSALKELLPLNYAALEYNYTYV